MSDQLTLRVILKDVKPHSLAHEAAQVIPEFIEFLEYMDMLYMSPDWIWHVEDWVHKSHMRKSVARLAPKKFDQACHNANFDFQGNDQVMFIGPTHSHKPAPTELKRAQAQHFTETERIEYRGSSPVHIQWCEDLSFGKNFAAILHAVQKLYKNNPYKDFSDCTVSPVAPIGTILDQISIYDKGHTEVSENTLTARGFILG